MKRRMVAGATLAVALTVLGVGAVMGLVGFTAWLRPARRATRVDPMIARRCG